MIGISHFSLSWSVFVPHDGDGTCAGVSPAEICWGSESVLRFPPLHKHDLHSGCSHFIFLPLQGSLPAPGTKFPIPAGKGWEGAML